MPQEYLRAVQARDQDVNPLFTFLNAQVLSAENGMARVKLPISPKLAQGGGMVAGGMLATLADEVMAHAVLSMLHAGQHTATAEMNVRFLRAADPKADGYIEAVGRVIKPGRSLMFAEAEVTDNTGRLLAKAGGTFWVGEHSALGKPKT